MARFKEKSAKVLAREEFRLTIIRCNGLYCEDNLRKRCVRYTAGVLNSLIGKTDILAKVCVHFISSFDSVKRKRR